MRKPEQAFFLCGQVSVQVISHCRRSFKGKVGNPVRNMDILVVPDPCDDRDGELGYVCSQVIVVVTVQVCCGPSAPDHHKYIKITSGPDHLVHGTDDA